MRLGMLGWRDAVQCVVRSAMGCCLRERDPGCLRPWFSSLPQRRGPRGAVVFRRDHGQLCHAPGSCQVGVDQRDALCLLSPIRPLREGAGVLCLRELPLRAPRGCRALLLPRNPTRLAAELGAVAEISPQPALRVVDSMRQIPPEPLMSSAVPRSRGGTRGAVGSLSRARCLVRTAGWHRP